MNTYLFVLGRNPDLSRTEIRPLCTEILYDNEKALLLAQDLVFENPRGIPREKEQLFLDRLGGVIRIASVIDEYPNIIKVKEAISQIIHNEKPEGKVHLGISAFGCGRDFLRSFLPEIKNTLKDKNRNCRIINLPGQNLDSGKIFGEKLLKKGFEFIIWKRGNTYLLSKTVANQNLQNYTLRDRVKDFRDSKMGMLPPKLAQILINLASPHWDQTIIDPFCGSGTINIEAAIMGYKTIGSDIESTHTLESNNNFIQMSDKFRYDDTGGKFFPIDAVQFPYQDYPQSVIVTEGTLGHNFERMPLRAHIEKEAHHILELWEKLFDRIENSSLKTVVFCLPIWHTQREDISLRDHLFKKLQSKHSSFTAQPFSNGEKSFVYARPDAYVGREICVMTRKKEEKNS